MNATQKRVLNSKILQFTGDFARDMVQRFEEEIIPKGDCSPTECLAAAARAQCIVVAWCEMFDKAMKRHKLDVRASGLVNLIRIVRDLAVIPSNKSVGKYAFKIITADHLSDDDGDNMIMASLASAELIMDICGRYLDTHPSVELTEVVEDAMSDYIPLILQPVWNCTTHCRHEGSALTVINEDQRDAYDVLKKFAKAQLTRLAGHFGVSELVASTK